jgi:hypothetical protein
MSTLKRNEFPPGGWRFYQPETKWNAPDPLINSFSRMVAVIYQHRAANPKAALSLDTDQIGRDLEEYTRARLGIRPFAPYAELPEKPAKTRKGCGTCGNR